MHKAIVKCNRIEIKWGYYNNEKSIEFWKNEYFKAKKNDRYYSFRSSRDYEGYWKDALSNNGVNYHTFPSGECVIWEGEVNQERLRVDDYLFIPTLNDYFKITKVETTPIGEITYYINYNKLFKENGEHSRLKSIEYWINDEYPEIDKFEDMINHRYDIDELKKEYNERNKYDDIEEDLNKFQKEIGSSSSEKYKYEQTPEDLNLEKVLIICGISAVVIIGIMFMIGLS